MKVGKNVGVLTRMDVTINVLFSDNPKTFKKKEKKEEIRLNEMSRMVHRLEFIKCYTLPSPENPIKSRDTTMHLVLSIFNSCQFNCSAQKGN